MRILYLSQYFPPEAGATQTRAYEMARALYQHGHSVTMLTEIPNHPSGVIPLAYRGKLYERTKMDGIDVVRVWVKASPKKNFRSRILFYLSFMSTATLAGLFLSSHNYDLIYCSSPPLFVGAAGLVISRIKRLPFIFEVRDLWPESAVVLGELSKKRWISWAEHLELACYKHARKIIVVTRGIHERLLQRKIPEERLAIIPNGANLDLFCYKPDEREILRQQMNCQKSFVVIYAGIFGLAQGLETIIETANLLRDNKSIHFILLGEGPRKSAITALVKQHELSNINILPEQPREMIPAYLSAADVALVPLKKIDLFQGALPTKIFDAWACQRPVILSIDGEARQVMEKAQAGIYVPPEDSLGLAQAILKLQAEPTLCTKMGAKGRAFTAKNYSRSTQAEKLINVLEAELGSDS